MPKAIWRSEKLFTTEMWRAIKHALLWKVYFYHKYPDLGTSIWFDAWLQMIWKRYIAMEYKLNRHEKNLELNKFFYWREHELTALSRQVNMHNEAYIIVNCYFPRKHNYCLIFTVEQYYWLLKKISPKKSIKLDDPLLMRYSTRMDQYDFMPNRTDWKMWDCKLFLWDI